MIDEPGEDEVVETDTVTDTDDDPDIDLDSDDLYGDPDEWVTALMQGKDIPKLKASTLRDPRVRPYIEPFRQKAAQYRKDMATKEAAWKTERDGLTARERQVLSREKAAREEVTSLLARFESVTKGAGAAGAGAGKADAKGQGAKGDALPTGDPRMDAIEAWARDQAKAAAEADVLEMKGRIDKANDTMKARWAERTAVDRSPAEPKRAAAIQGVLAGLDPIKVERAPAWYLDLAIDLTAHPEGVKLAKFVQDNHDLLIPAGRLQKDAKETAARILEVAVEHGIITAQKVAAAVPPEVRKAQIQSGKRVAPPNGKAWSMADFVELDAETQANLLASDPQVAAMIRRSSVAG